MRPKSALEAAASSRSATGAEWSTWRKETASGTPSRIAVTRGRPECTAASTRLTSSGCFGQATTTALPALIASRAAASGPPRFAPMSGSCWRRDRSTPIASQRVPRGSTLPGGARCPQASPLGSSRSRGPSPSASASPARPARCISKAFRDAAVVATPPWPNVSGPRSKTAAAAGTRRTWSSKGIEASVCGAARAARSQPSRTGAKSTAGSGR
mmetsp:Transcript_10842/g.36796  ORF Transcript_10842/g.36796 Transcript_10842/m.36796 type:complete len:213 (-) Transcript_10842:4564-5202(-)